MVLFPTGNASAITFENRSGKGLRARRGGWRGARRAHIREKSVTEERRSQPPRPAARPTEKFSKHALLRRLRDRIQFAARQFVPGRGESDEHIRRICEERATKPWDKVTAAQRVALLLASGVVAPRSQPHWRGYSSLRLARSQEQRNKLYSIPESPQSVMVSRDKVGSPRRGDRSGENTRGRLAEPPHL